MDSLERQLRHHSRSWKALVGAPTMTVLLVMTIAWSTAAIERPKRADVQPLSFAYVPPPPTPMKKVTAPPLSAGLAESFAFDPSIASPPPDIPLDALDIRLDPHVNGDLAVELDMQRTFEVQKPEDLERLVVFERDQVDEIPVWLYGPMPRIPSRLDRKDLDLLVLYIVSDKGRTENIYVLDATDNEFIAPAKEAITNWRFRPARKGGKPVRVWVQHSVTYRPESKSPFTL